MGDVVDLLKRRRAADKAFVREEEAEADKLIRAAGELLSEAYGLKPFEALLLGISDGLEAEMGSAALAETLVFYASTCREKTTPPAGAA